MRVRHELLSFRCADAIHFGEEIAAVLYVLRQVMLFHDREILILDGIEHTPLSERFFESFLPHKPLRRTKTILRKLNKLNVISIKEGNYYAVLE